MTTVKDLTRAIAAFQPGSTIKIGLWRDGKEMTLMAKLGDSELTSQGNASGSPPRGDELQLFGMSLAPITPEVRQELGLKNSVKGAIIAFVEPGGQLMIGGCKPAMCCNRSAVMPLVHPRRPPRSQNKPVAPASLCF
jgi:serine protease Do